MRTLFGRARRHRLTIIGTLVSLTLWLAVAACAPVAPADGPDAVVGDALAKVAAKDIDGLRALACAGQADLIGDQLGIPGGVGGELLPGLDTQAVVDAIRLDVTGVKLGDAAIDGDTAQVPVTGTIKVTFDSAAMRPLLRQVLDNQGTTMTDEQLDALLKTLEASGQDVPVDQSVRLLREDGAWKVCQDTLEAPAAS
jgi:hypothetical protein